MNYKEFITNMSKKTGVTQKELDSDVEALVEVMKDAFEASNTVSFQGFGSFELKRKEERVAKNPSTQKRILIPPSVSLVFKPSAVLKEEIKEIRQR